MKNLYLLQGTSTVLHVGVITNGETLYDAAGVKSEITNFTFLKPGDAYSAIYALQTSQATASWCVGLDNGTAAPTASGGKFVLPTTRTYDAFDAKVENITEYLTNSGPMVNLFLDLSYWD